MLSNVRFSKEDAKLKNIDHEIMKDVSFSRVFFYKLCCDNSVSFRSFFLCVCVLVWLFLSAIFSLAFPSKFPFNSCFDVLFVVRLFIVRLKLMRFLYLFFLCAWFLAFLSLLNCVRWWSWNLFGTEYFDPLKRGAWLNWFDFDGNVEICTTIICFTVYIFFISLHNILLNCLFIHVIFLKEIVIFFTILV